MRRLWLLSRRDLGGLGAMAMASFVPRTLRADAPARRGFGRAKNVIFLHMAGAPSQLDLWDHKPTLNRLDGSECPKQLLEGKRFAFIRGVPRMLGSKFKFAQYGQSGAWLSDLLPNFASVVDDVAIVKSMHTDEFNHAPGQLMTLTGRSQFGGASLGSWLSYGLGETGKNLPAFVVLLSGGKTPDGGKSLWGNGFLPSVHQGVECRNTGDPILFLGNPEGVSRETRRDALDVVGRLNRNTAVRTLDGESEARIAQYELAFRMQTAVPDAVNIAAEPKHILDLYGAVPGFATASESADDPRTLFRGTDARFANNCLLARRLVENGVRFVQLFDWGWDHHGATPGESIDQTLPIKAQQIDRAVTGLLKDLKQRGLLDETLVVWASEFGRTPMQQNAQTQRFIGRDHHPHAFTIWMAGGGIRGGQTYGETDEIGYYPVKNPMHVRDLQATILHLAGFDPWRFSYPFSGLDQRLIGPDDSKVRLHEELLG
ncbi:MAG: DUF1501 domain-containing protein [Deltaproteobacteria bacterium]|nr:DUF1501 domain-containing protein [Deltaproteobacteria bacterium]